jgi:hypothetical protein
LPRHTKHVRLLDESRLTWLAVSQFLSISATVVENRGQIFLQVIEISINRLISWSIVRAVSSNRKSHCEIRGLGLTQKGGNATVKERVFL